jgi:RNA polymerase sigma factor (sigma-70 family)
MSRGIKSATAGLRAETMPTPKDLSDEALLLMIRATAEQRTIDELFAEIFERYHTRVVSWCYAVARDREIALDLAQEVFLKVFRNLHAFRGDARMSTWIYVITRNHCLNSLRKNDADPSTAASEIPMNIQGDNGLKAHQALENAESFRNLHRTISGILTPLEIQVLWLHYGHDLTLDAITRRLVLSNRSGAKAFIVSAKRKLKLYLHNRGITLETIEAAPVRAMAA